MILLPAQWELVSFHLQEPWVPAAAVNDMHQHSSPQTFLAYQKTKQNETKQNLNSLASLVLTFRIFALGPTVDLLLSLPSGAQIPMCPLHCDGSADLSSLSPATNQPDINCFGD